MNCPDCGSGTYYQGEADNECADCGAVWVPGCSTYLGGSR